MAKLSNKNASGSKVEIFSARGKGIPASAVIMLGAILIALFAVVITLLTFRSPELPVEQQTNNEVVVENTAVNGAIVTALGDTEIVVESEGKRSRYGLSSDVSVSIFDPSTEPEFRKGTLEDVRTGAKVNLILNKNNDVTSITVIS